MLMLKHFWYTQVIERITGRRFSGHYDYKGRALFAGDTFLTQVCYRGEWSDIGEVTVVEKICHPSQGVQDTQRYLWNEITFWWTSSNHSSHIRHIKL